jgi:transposase-like protein
VRRVVEDAMQEELTGLLQAEAYERTPTRRGQRNGSYPRDLVTGLGPLPLRVPRDRAGAYRSQVFDRYARAEPQVTRMLVDMFVGGVSQGQVGQVAETLLGVAPSASTVSRLAHDLQADCDAWRARALSAHYRVIYLDGVYFPIVHEDRADQTPLLVALGVDANGHKDVLGFVVAGQESRAAWQTLVDDLKRRGVQQVDLFVTDGDEGLSGVLTQAFPTAQRQRCLTHKVRNVLAHVPHRAKAEVAAALKGIFVQPTRAEAHTHLDAFGARYARVYPEAVATLQRDIADCLTFYDFPREMWKHIRTNNALEGLFSTVRRRTNKMDAFRNETSCILIVYAVIQTVRFRRIPV